jgi:ubiquinone/menaquinone biosynthesis C-methylase UbiE
MHHDTRNAGGFASVIWARAGYAPSVSLWADRVLPLLVEKSCRSGAILAERRRWIPRAHGDVLEIGIGSGLNLASYDPARVTRVTGIDPSRGLRARARPRVADAPVPVELADAAAEALPYADRSFDSVVLTYTLCSVDDPARALAEIRRVLRPGGELIFIEHGLAPDRRTEAWQHRLTPVWKRIGGNCHLDRDIARLVREAGFAFDELETSYVEGASWLSYTYRGIARAA